MKRGLYVFVYTKKLPLCRLVKFIDTTHATQHVRRVRGRTVRKLQTPSQIVRKKRTTVMWVVLRVCHVNLSLLLGVWWQPQRRSAAWKKGCSLQPRGNQDCRVCFWFLKITFEIFTVWVESGLNQSINPSVDFHCKLLVDWLIDEKLTLTWLVYWIGTSNWLTLQCPAVRRGEIRFGFCCRTPWKSRTLSCRARLSGPVGGLIWDISCPSWMPQRTRTRKSRKAKP